VVDPLTLTALSATALTQGIGFLYGQLSDLLRRRRERRQGGETPAEIPAIENAPEVLNGDLVAGAVDDKALDDHADQLAGLRGLLLPYAEGDKDARPDNRQLLEQVEAARLLLEQIYQQHITFKGELRPATGTALMPQSGDVGQYAAQVVASGERAVAIGGNITGSTIITGDSTAPPDQRRSS
jgi:hypothetical protein